MSIEEVIEKTDALSVNEQTSHIDKINKEISIGWSIKVDNFIHLGHMMGFMKICEFLKNGHTVKILLDNFSSDLSKNNNMHERTIFKTKVIRTMLENWFARFGINMTLVEFCESSELKSREDYVMDFYKFVSLTKENEVKECIRMGAEKTLKMDKMLVPCIKALDFSSLNVECMLVGNNEEKLSSLSEELYKKLQMKNVSFIFNDIFYDYKNHKMSKKNVEYRISPLESAKNVEKKINKYFCEEGNAQNNVIKILKHVVIPYLEFTEQDIVFIDCYNVSKKYKNFEEIEEDFVGKALHPGDLKNNISRFVYEIFTINRPFIEENMKEIRKSFN